MGHRVIQLKKKIGQGGYGAIYLAMDEDTYKEYVLKRMDCKVWSGWRVRNGVDGGNGEAAGQGVRGPACREGPPERRQDLRSPEEKGVRRLGGS